MRLAECKILLPDSLLAPRPSLAAPPCALNPSVLPPQPFKSKVRTSPLLPPSPPPSPGRNSWRLARPTFQDEVAIKPSLLGAAFTLADIMWPRTGERTKARGGDGCDGRPIVPGPARHHHPFHVPILPHTTVLDAADGHIIENWTWVLFLDHKKDFIGQT